MADREPYPSEKQDRFIVRLPDGMRERIKTAADANNRSMNSEIVATLEEKYPAPRFRISGKTVTEWLNYVDAARSETDALRRVEEVNRQLAADPEWSGVKLYRTEPDPEFGFQTKIYIGRVFSGKP